MKEYKNFVQRIGLLGLTNFLVSISAIILLPILTKNISTSDYGIWVQINTTIMLITYITMLGLPLAMVTYLSIEKEKEKIQEIFYSIVAVVIFVSFIIIILFYLFSEPIANGLFGGNVNIAKITALIILIATLYSIFLNFFRTFQQMKIYSAFLLAQVYIAVLLVSYCVLSGLGLFTATIGLLMSYFIPFIIMLLLVISRIGLKIPKFRKIKEHLLFSLPTIPSNLSSWIVDSSDRYVIGILLGTVFVGYYSPGYTLGAIIMMILAPFSLLLPSVLPKYYAENQITTLNLYLKYSLKYFLLLAIPSAFGLSLLSKPILILLTTPEIALHGYLVTPFVAFSFLLLGVYSIISNILVLKKKTRIIGIIWIIAAIFNLSLNIVIVPYLGILGAAAVTMITYIIAFVLTIWYTNKCFTFDFELSSIFKSIISSIIMSFIILLINPYGINNIIIVICACSIVYFALLLSFKGVNKKELCFFRDLLQN